MNETNGQQLISSEPLVHRSIKFYLFISLQVPSVLISLYILWQASSHRHFRHRLNNHSIIGLILLSFLETTTELPIALHYLRLGHVQPRTNSFCLFWIWYNFSLQTTNLSMMTWTSIERHVFIFHSHWFQRSYGKWKYHYIPLLISVTYIPIFYFVCIFVYQCENVFDYSSLLCGTICYNRVTWLSTFDWMSNMLFPSLLIPFTSVSLLIRFLFQKKRMKRTLKWRVIRKMIIQLMTISLLYLTFWMPLALVSLIRIYFLPTFLTEITYYYLYYTPYLVQLLFPFVCIASLPEIWPRRNRVHSMSPIHNAN